MEEYCRILILDDEFIMRQGMKHMVDWTTAGALRCIRSI